MNRAVAVLGCALATCGLLAASRARAAPPARFAQPGSVSLGFSGSLELQHPRSPEPQVVALGLASDVLVFVAEGFGLGAAASFGYDTGEGYKSSALGVHALVGYHVWLAERASVLVRASLGYARASLTLDPQLTLPVAPSSPAVGALGEVSGESDALEGTLAGVLLYHPATHVFVGAGPTLTLRAFLHDSLHDSEHDWELALGLRSVVGAWF